MRLILLFVSFMFLSACSGGDGRDSTASGERIKKFDLEKSLKEARQDAERLLGEHGGDYRAAWDQEASGSAWSEAVLSFVKANQEIFDAPADIDDFCPGYSSSTPYQKNTCWLRIISALAFYESGFNPEKIYVEHNGKTSVGLFMMNPEHCPEASTIESLKIATANMECALTRMSLLLKRDVVVSGSNLRRRGAAAYWSPLRELYRFRDMMLGKKPHIFLFTRSYQAYPTRAGNR